MEEGERQINKRGGGLARWYWRWCLFACLASSIPRAFDPASMTLSGVCVCVCVCVSVFFVCVSDIAFLMCVCMCLRFLYVCVVFRFFYVSPSLCVCLVFHFFMCVGVSLFFLCVS